MPSEFEKRPLTTYEEPTVPAEEDLSMCLSPEDTKTFYALKGEMKESWEKRQIYRTEVEMRIGVLEDFRHPTPSAKYWQAVREMSHYYENVVNGYFEYKRNEIEIKKIERQIKEEKDVLEKELLNISKQELFFKRATLQQHQKDRIRELRLWSKIKAELKEENPNLETEDVNESQKISLPLELQQRFRFLKHSPDVGGAKNAAAQIETAERLIREGKLEPKNLLKNDKKHKKLSK
jgi:hypothetical protein